MTVPVRPVAHDPHAAYARPCYALAQRIVADPLVARSIVDDVFASWTAPAADDPAADDPARASPATQLTAIVHRRAVEHTRERDKTPGRGTDLRGLHTLTAAVSGSRLLAAANPARRRVITALALLPEEQRAPILLAYLDGLTQTQIARQLNIPLATVRSRTRHGMTRLGQHLSAPRL